jgi:hypothetical protein
VEAKVWDGVISLAWMVSPPLQETIIAESPDKISTIKNAIFNTLICVLYFTNIIQFYKHSKPLKS